MQHLHQLGVETAQNSARGYNQFNAYKEGLATKQALINQASQQGSDSLTPQQVNQLHHAEQVIESYPQDARSHQIIDQQLSDATQKRGEAVSQSNTILEVINNEYNELISGGLSPSQVKLQLDLLAPYQPSPSKYGQVHVIALQAGKILEKELELATRYSR